MLLLLFVPIADEEFLVSANSCRTSDEVKFTSTQSYSRRFMMI
ncbi:unnamed protein product [Linum tenue]|uniref:Uncharacterized protein n=1 Tax=Linum tenue TaxID=586396 RepID=A0AAV0K3U8_9ROSI|nr:unnamed protein product [Linum tenue]